MKRLLPILLAVLLSACAGPGAMYETVRDQMPTCSAGDAPCFISLCVPPEAVLTSCTPEARVYLAKNGDYEITARVLVTDGLDAAVYAVAGNARSRLCPANAGERECQLAWSSKTAAGSSVCRALVRLDGEFAYCLCLRMRAGLGVRYNGEINALFSSFALYPKESVGIPPARSQAFPHSAPHTSHCRH